MLPSKQNSQRSGDFNYRYVTAGDDVYSAELCFSGLLCWWTQLPSLVSLSCQEFFWVLFFLFAFLIDYFLLQIVLTSILLSGVFLSDLIFNQHSWTCWNQRSGFVNSLLLLELNNCQCLPKVPVCVLRRMWANFIWRTDYLLQRFSLIKSLSIPSIKVVSFSVSLWQVLLCAQICFRTKPSGGMWTLLFCVTVSNDGQVPGVLKWLKFLHVNKSVQLADECTLHLCHLWVWHIIAKTQTRCSNDEYAKICMHAQLCTERLIHVMWGIYLSRPKS